MADLASRVASAEGRLADCELSLSEHRLRLNAGAASRGALDENMDAAVERISQLEAHRDLMDRALDRIGNLEERLELTVRRVADLEDLIARYGLDVGKASDLLREAEEDDPAPPKLGAVIGTSEAALRALANGGMVRLPGCNEGFKKLTHMPDQWMLDMREPGFTWEIRHG